MIKKTILILILILIAVFLIAIDQSFEADNMEEIREKAEEGTKDIPPKLFTTDGCTLWPNKFLGSDIVDACIEHDIKYWKGGSQEEREDADSKMRDRVNKTIYPVGDIMYWGVRAFGDPWVPAPWKWGYGFNRQ